jgi:hypothetical protein
VITSPVFPRELLSRYAGGHDTATQEIAHSKTFGMIADSDAP